MVVHGVGRAAGTLTLHRDRKLGVRLNRGCFSGSFDEFMSRLEDIPQHDFYRAIVPPMVAELRRRMTPLDHNSKDAKS